MRGTLVLGVKTIGNATLIAYDEGPVLATDPWFGDEDHAFFGSWGLSHEVLAAEKADIKEPSTYGFRMAIPTVSRTEPFR